MTQTQRKLNVLDDKGYVLLHDVMGGDITVANAARVSYDKKTDELTERDERLIAFLAREGHTSPFRHAMLQFEVYAPLMVARQHWKYVAGSSFQEASGDNMTAWNESSRRYVTEEPAFYVPKPNEWRSAPDNSKQGSGEIVDEGTGFTFATELERYIQYGERMYRTAMHDGVCAEQARLFLPAYGMYVRYYWTASLQSVAHFVQQRLANDAQVEIQAYAKAVLELARPHFPTSIDALIGVEPDAT